MTHQRLDERAIFLQAIEIDSADDRSRYLDRACENDDRLRHEIDALLAAHNRSLGLLDEVDPPDARPWVGEQIGTTIGRYKLLEVIGEGGMGVVYMAEQTSPVRRMVALKIIKPGMDTRQVVARFEAERQAIALMDHSNIARVLDAGATESGRPYFVMELVKGIPITDYCDRELLNLHDRLDLFVLVCRAVHHAHQKGIIHRDIKPSNVLVTLHDGVPVPKVIDFGIAKATTGVLTDKTLFTGLAQLIGTPVYMSPEQAELSGLDIDTRSDIYSLGVLLYELLTGTTPFDSETLKKAAFDEMRRIIREVEPPRPSTRLTSLTSPTSSRINRNSKDARRSTLAVKGELDWIVMKALEKDRRRRFETANDFAADVMRHLTDQPVESCPPSAWYRFSKFARRNRLMLSMGLLLTVSLFTGAGISVWQASRASRAAADSELRADESRQVIDYLVRDIFNASVPGKGHSRSLNLGELLDRAETVVGNRFKDRPLVEASIRMALSQSYRALIELDRAKVHATRASELRTRILGPEHPDTLVAMEELATVLNWGGWKTRAWWDESEWISRRVLETRRRVLGHAHLETIRGQVLLAFTLHLMGRLDEAIALASEAEALAVDNFGPDHELTLGAWDCLGQIVARRGEAARGENLLRRCIAGRERLYGALDGSVIDALYNLAKIVRREGQLKEAKALHLEALNRGIQTYGITHISCSMHMHESMSVLKQIRATAEIRDHCQEWLGEMVDVPREDDPYTRRRRSITLAKVNLWLIFQTGTEGFDADLAVRAAREAASLTDSAYFWSHVGLVLERANRPLEAVQALKTATGRPGWNGGGAYHWLTTARLQLREGDLVAARESYERSLADPDESWREDLEVMRGEVASLLRAKSDENPQETSTGTKP